MAANLGRKLFTSPVVKPLFARPWLSASCRCRCFGTSIGLQSGHSKWATIKHDKAKNDKNKSKERSAISKDIIAASKQGGPDPKTNPRLHLAVSSAKRAGMAKSTIEASIMRGQGINTSGAPLESVTIEAMLPGSVAAVIECQTESKARLLQDLRLVIKNGGGTVTPTSYLFEKKGQVTLAMPEGSTADDFLEQAIEAGAMDIDTDSEGRLILLTDPSETKAIGDAFSQATGLRIENSDIIHDPNKETMVALSDEDEIERLEELIENLREDGSVQDIYLNCTTKF
ncbi:hypothetical protein KEM55_004495 [Ascosphaera atra]|nr:hypothetical protein KEM55_004495 [Ascosphaera atra]